MEKDKKKALDIEHTMMFIDSSALRDMFNGDNTKHAKDMLDIMKRIKDSGKVLHLRTSLATFLNAIWNANPDAKINDIQKTITFLDIQSSLPRTDFKSDKSVEDELIAIMKFLGEMNKRAEEKKKEENKNEKDTH